MAIRIIQPASDARGDGVRVVSPARKATLADDVMGAITTLNRSIPGVDEAADALQAGVDLATGRAKTPQEAWRGARARSKGASDDFHLRRPVAANLTSGTGLALQAAPALLTGGATVAPQIAAAAPAAGRGLLASSARAAGRLAAPTAKSAVVAGLGAQATGLAGEGGLEERVADANRATAPAMIIGGALPPALAAASAARRATARGLGGAGTTAARLANRATGGKVLDPQMEAARRLGEALKADGLGPQEVRAALESWQTTGASSPALLDLAGENTRALLRSAASKTGAARNMAVDFANEVTGDLQPNAIARTRALTPDRRAAGEIAEEIGAQRAKAAGEMYPAFSGERVPITDQILSAADGGARWMREAAQLAAVERKADVADEIGRLIRGEEMDDISAGALDYIRRALRDAGGEAAASGRGGMARALGDRARDLEQALIPVPGFDKARSTYRGYSQQLDAIEQGGRVLNEVPDDFARTFEALPVEQGGVGARQALEEAIGRPAEGATGTLNRIASSTNAGRNLETLYGPEEAAAYRNAIGREIDKVSNARFVSPNTGSQTALREVDDALVDLPPMSKLGLLKAAIDKVRRGVSLTDAERAALMELGTRRIGSPEALPDIPEARPLGRMIAPAQRQRIARTLALSQGAERAQPEPAY